MTKTINKALRFNLVDSKILCSKSLIGSKKLFFFFSNAKFVLGFRNKYAVHDVALVKCSLKAWLKLARFFALKRNEFWLKVLRTDEALQLSLLDNSQNFDHLPYKLIGSRQIRELADKLLFIVLTNRNIYL